MKRSMKVFGLSGVLLLALLSAGGYLSGKDILGKLTKEEFCPKDPKASVTLYRQ